MTKEKRIEKMEKLASINNNVVPTKNIDSGSKGKLLEMQVKMLLHGKIAQKNGISSKGKVDTTYKGYKIEIKSCCGTIDGIEKNDFIIYSYDGELFNCKVFDTARFIDILNECELIRVKKTTAGYRVKAIQTFKNSKKRMNKFINLLNYYGTDLVEWKNTIDNK